MTKKQMAALAAAVLTAAAGLLTQCPDDPAPSAPVAPAADAGAR